MVCVCAFVHRWLFPQNVSQSCMKSGNCFRVDAAPLPPWNDLLYLLGLQKCYGLQSHEYPALSATYSFTSFECEEVYGELNLSQICSSCPGCVFVDRMLILV